MFGSVSLASRDVFNKELFDVKDITDAVSYALGVLYNCRSSHKDNLSNTTRQRRSEAKRGLKTKLKLARLVTRIVSIM